jgi:hypothetical protein
VSFLHEFGDPVHEAIARDERTDHFRGAARGRRVLLIADRLVAELEGHALVRDVAIARLLLFHILCDELYGGVSAVDVPDFTSQKSLETMRRGTSE